MHSTTHTYQFIAGNLALDFVNTVAFRADPERKKDRLQRSEDVHQWARQAHLPDWAAIKSGPATGIASLRRIRATREHLFSVLHAITCGDVMSADTLARVGNAFNECRARQRLSFDKAGARWVWRASARCADYVLYPVLTSAIGLLTSDSHSLVRQCEDTDCGWLFLDRSNSRKRRWCSMADCGNRNKARNFYRREMDLR